MSKEKTIWLDAGCHYSFASYFFLGFQELARRQSIKVRFSPSAASKHFSIDAKSSTLVFVTYEGPCGARLAVIDVADSADPASPGAYSFEALEAVDIYFKVNFGKEALLSPLLQRYAEKIRPAPPFFAIRPRMDLGVIYSGAVKRGVVDTVLTHRAMVPSSFYQENISHKKDLDYAFVVTYYDHPDHREDNLSRLELIKKLKEQKTLHGFAAFAANKPVPSEFSDHVVNFLPLRNLLKTYSRSKAAIYVRGLHNCLSFKLGQYLALEMPIVGQPILRDNPFAKSIPHYADQFCFESPDDLVRGLKERLAMPGASLSKLGRDNRSYFESEIAPLPTAEYILRVLESP